jgi:hypothetical protein
MLSALNIVVKHPKKNNKGDSKDMKPTDPNLHKNKGQVDDLIRSVIQDYMMQHGQLKNEKSKNLQNLTGLISEYLSAFIVLGYDINGAPVNLIHAKNQMDADALSAAINRFIFNVASNPDSADEK